MIDGWGSSALEDSPGKGKDAVHYTGCKGDEGDTEHDAEQQLETTADIVLVHDEYYPADSHCCDGDPLPCRAGDSVHHPLKRVGKLGDAARSNSQVGEKTEA